MIGVPRPGVWQHQPRSAASGSALRTDQVGAASMTGFEITRFVRDERPLTKVIQLSADGSACIMTSGQAHGPETPSTGYSEDRR